MFGNIFTFGTTRTSSRIAEDHIVLGNGVDLGNPTRMIPIQLPNPFRRGHMFTFGTTRSGKSKLAENMIEQDIRAGRSVIYMDPKLDVELFSKIVQTAIATGRKDELMLITPIFPEYSAVIDPLAYYFMPDELVGHTVSGIKEGKDPFFRNVAKDITISIIMAQKILAEASGKRLSITLNDIKKRASRGDLEKLKEELTALGTPEAVEQAEDIQRAIEAGQEYFSKVSASLRVALTELTAGNIGRIIGKADENRFIRRLEEGQRVICVVQLGSMITNEAAFTLGKVFLSMIKSFIGRVFASKRQKISPPLCLYIDEFQSVVFPGAEDLFAKGAGADLWIHAFAQSVNQIYAAVGEEYGKAILDNTNTKLFLKVPDYETAEYVAKHFGTHRVLSPIMNASGGITSREMEDDVLKPQHVLRLKPREFYMMTYSDEGHSGLFRGQTCDVSKIYQMIEFPDAPSTDEPDTLERDRKEAIFYAALDLGDSCFQRIAEKYYDVIKAAGAQDLAAIGFLVDDKGEPDDPTEFSDVATASAWLFAEFETYGRQKALVAPPDRMEGE